MRKITPLSLTSLSICSVISWSPSNNHCLFTIIVIQDDLMMGVLTVRENLQFSAALRLPSNMTYQQRRDRVDRIIEQLGLQGCANTKVHSEIALI